MDFLEETHPNSIISLSGASKAAAGAGTKVFSLIIRSDFSTVGRLSLTDLNESLDALLESTDFSLIESLLNSESDWVALLSAPI